MSGANDTSTAGQEQEAGPKHAGEWRGRSLGTRTVAYDETEAILYALAVGADPADLELVFEDRLRVLPTFALTRAQWAPDVLGSAGAFDTSTAVHGSQRLTVRKPLPRSGEIEMSARVAQVWDKGGAAVFEVAVESDYFEATWSIFAPGCGGFGGERGASAAKRPDRPADHEVTVATEPNQAVLYRLLGDRHHLHVDPEAAKAAGMPKPILHGLCTLAAVTLPLAGTVGAHPSDLLELDGRFASPVFPGDTLQISVWNEPAPGNPEEAATPNAGGVAVRFEAAVDGTTVLSAGRAVFHPTR